MKKHLLLVLLTFLAALGFSQSNVPNGNLENWYNVPVSGTLNYDQPGTGPADNWLCTLNELAAVPFPLGPGPVTVFKTDDVHSGNFAAKCVSAQYGPPINVFIPGMLGTATLDMPGQRALVGRPCSGCRPLHLKGWYKFTPVNGDSAAAVLLVSKWNSTTKKRDTIGFGKQVFKSEVSQYAEFDVAMNYNYPSSSLSSDSMSLLTVSSAGFSVINFMGGVGQPGSTLYIDDLMLGYPAGIEQALMPDVTVKIYPNPAKDIMTIELSEQVKEGSLEVYTMDGKMVFSYSINEVINTLPVYSLASGSYYFKLKEGKEIVNTGSFIIKR
jgi:hypothetical protein